MNESISSGPAAGEMARRIREADWSKTPLGPVCGWSQSLRASVATMLASGFPMAILWGPGLTLIYNDACRAIVGDRHPSALGRPLCEGWAEVHAEIAPVAGAILRGERAAYFAEDQARTVQRAGAAGETAWFTTGYSPIPDDAAPGGIGGVLAIGVDTTRRVRQGQALESLNARLEAEVAHRTRERDRIWQVSEDLLGVADFEGRLLSVNPAWTTLLGWREDELRGMPVNALRHPEDSAHSMGARARLAAGAPTVRLENRYRHKDGSWRWLSWTMSVEGDLIYVIGRHVTAEKEAAEARRASERQFRLLVSGMTDYALFMLDPQGIVSSWNAGAQRISGYAETEIVGQHFSRFYMPEDRAAELPQNALDSAARSGTYEAEGWRQRKDGSRYFASVVVEAIRDEHGALIGFAKITRDITERHEAQTALQRAQEQLVQSQKMEALGQLTGGIAHDFNNMLMVVSGNAQSLKRRFTDPAGRRAIEAIEHAAARGENLTRQLLTFSRRQALNPSVIAVGEHLAAFRDVLVSSARGDIALDIDIPGNVWPVFVDAAEFELALVNLVVNARDAMPDGGTIRISAKNVNLRARDTPDGLRGDFVAIRVADTGCGIAAETLAKVFEPFFTTKGPGRGTGLGLSQVYGFIRQSGGTVTISSQVARGTTLTLYLPRSDPAPVDLVPRPEVPPHGSETILLVEDNPDVEEVAGMLLAQLGYRVRQADSATAALKLLDEGEPIALVFTDVVMPGPLDGVALARRVRAEHPQVAVLLTSGYAKLAGAAAHGFPVLRKPYRMAVLARAIRDALEGHKSNLAAGR